jgi:hypothetical protein
LFIKRGSVECGIDATKKILALFENRTKVDYPHSPLNCRVVGLRTGEVDVVP